MTIVERVYSERARARRAVAASAGATAVGALGAMLMLGAMVLGGGRWLTLPVIAPFLWWAAAAALAVFVVRRVPRRLGARATDEAVARAAETERGLRAGALVGLVQIAPAGGALMRMRAEQLGATVGIGALAPRHGRRLLMNAVAALAGVVTIAAGMVQSGARYGDGWRALAHPFAAARGELISALSLEETPVAVLRGEPLTAIVSAEGRRSVRLSWRATGAAWRDTTLLVEHGRARVSLGPADAPVMLVASDGRTHSDSVAVGVHDRPFAGDVSVRAVYPSYLGIASEVLSPDGPMRFPEGTALEIVVRTAGLADVALTDTRDTIAMAIDAGRARARLVAASSGSWQWFSATPGADLPPRLTFDVIVDDAPAVEIVSPSRDTLVSAGDDVRLVVAAIDDHGLTSVQLQMTRERRTGERDGEDTHRMRDVTGDRWFGELSISLAALNLNPGDAITIVAEARDGAPWGRVGTSRRLVLRVATADEQRDAATDAADSTLDHVADAIDAQRGLERRTGDAARAAGRSDQQQQQQQGSQAGDQSRGASFEAQERAREVLEDQRAANALADTLSREAQQLAQELQKAGVLDSTLGAQLREVERLLQDAMTPAMRQQMRELEEQRSQMSGEELRQALSNLQQPQRNALESLERAYEMLKRAALEGKMQSLSDKASELAQQQQQFADSAAGAGQAGTPPPATAKELADRADAIQREAQELIERLQREQAQAAQDGTQKAASAAEESARQMQEAMRRAMEQLGGDSLQQAQARQQQQQQQQGGQQGGQQAGQQGDRSSIQQSSQQAADAMRDASQSFAQARQQQVDEWKRELTEALDRSIQETLQMARQQEQLGQQAQQGASQQQLRAEQGALQQGVRQTSERVSEQGQKSALVSPNSQRAMDGARQRVEQATRDVSDGATGQQASQSMQDAADALRQAAAAMARDRERAGSAQSASGMQELMEQMRDLANQQGQLAGQAASMLPQSGQMAAGSAEREQLQQLADRQRQLAQRIEDASDADRSGRAEAMAREARQIAQQLERGSLDPSVIDRQQRLFKRMLDAGRTLEQDGREESDRREARSGAGVLSNAPATGAARGADALRFREPTYEELRSYTADERRLIIEYFRRMNARQQ